jgi:hypothetical protein
LEIETFVDQIDTRGGYFYGIAKSLDDFSEELNDADGRRAQERVALNTNLHQAEEQLPMEQVQFVQQLVNVLALPVEDDVNVENIPYDEKHRTMGAQEQDELMPHIARWLKEKAYKPEGFTDKNLDKLRRVGNRFLVYKERIYRRGKESQHCLYVPKERRTYMRK